MTRKFITNSSASCFKQCRKRYWWSYDLGIRPEYDGRALRMVSAYHDALDLLRTTNDLDTAITAARSHYEHCPEQFDLHEWEIERETVAALVSSYAWRWGESLKVVASEMKFQIRLRNPETNAPSTLFDLAGKLDGIVELEDGRLAVLESKTVSEDIAFESGYWQRLQMDHQITLYLWAARQLGHDVATVLYDVTRKPTIAPTPIAVCDDLGAKIVLDGAGNRVKTERGQWRQTSDKEKGYILQTRDMTADEFAKKLTDDIGERPEFYYCRREIPRIDQDVEEFLSELWDIQKTLRECQVQNRWYKTVSKDTCSWCPYFGLCSAKFNPNDSLPQGFIRIEDIHPELAG